MRLLLTVLALAALIAGGGPAHAELRPWGLNFQPAVSPTMEQLTALHDLLLWIIAFVSLFVLALLALACVRFRASRSPTPSRRTHHTVLEIAWTVVPVLILVVIAIPSFKLLYFMDRVEEPELTLKAIGRQWYWSYEFPDYGNFTFDAYMVPEEELEPGQLRLLTTDTALVLPIETNIQLLTTASDVLHSWAMPPFGVKMDAVPGLLNETWFRITEPGTYYGQCSELCGDYHAFMPIMVRAVPKEEFEAWATQAQEEFARAGGVEFAAEAAPLGAQD